MPPEVRLNTCACLLWHDQYSQYPQTFKKKKNSLTVQWYQSLILKPFFPPLCPISLLQGLSEPAGGAATFGRLRVRWGQRWRVQGRR